ncbi:MAG: metal ABC transporter permease [Promethearchaeota archaeon]
MSYSDFWNVLQYEYMQRALFASIMVGIICGIVGVFILLRGLVFMGAGIAHASFAGGALAILLGINPFISIFLFGTGSAFSIGYINEKGYMDDNNVAIGIIFSLTMALAILFMSLIQSYSADVNALLFGNVLVVTTEDTILLVEFAILIIGIIYFFKKELFFTIFDEEMAQATGVPTRSISYLFLLLISLTIVVSLKAIGAILVFAMIITPAASAYQWSYKLTNMLILSAIFGAISSFIGLYLSYTFDLPSGSSITIVISIIFLISLILSPKRRTGKAIGIDHSCKTCEKADAKGGCIFCEEEIELAHNHNSHKHH